MLNSYGPYTTASDGVAAVSTNRNLPTKLRGELQEIRVSIVGGAAVGVTIVTVPQTGDQPGAQTLLAVTGLAPGNYIYPVRRLAVDTAGANLAGSFVELVVDAIVNIAHASTGASTVTITLVTEGE